MEEESVAVGFRASFVILRNDREGRGLRSVALAANVSAEIAGVASQRGIPVPGVASVNIGGEGRLNGF